MDSVHGDGCEWFLGGVEVAWSAANECRLVKSMLVLILILEDRRVA